MKRYVTYLVTYLGDKLPKFYIGSTSASEETKKKLSDLKKGKPKSPETKEKMRLAWIERRKKKEENENN